MKAVPFSPGFAFAGRYRVVRELATGGMGVVYEATHLVTGRSVALKVMLGHTLDQAELRARFLQEARVAAQIKSAHVVDVLDAGIDTETGIPFLVMELLVGEDFAERITRLGALPAAEAVTYLWQMALALDKLHKAGVVHRDLKPRNLFLTSADDGAPLVKVLDFGVAKQVPLEGAHDNATQNIGTPLYMAPEQFRPEGRISAATDIYALGMMAYTLIVGAQYWREENARSKNPFAFARIVSDGPRERASERASVEGIELSPAFDEWFLKATALSPDDRFATATDAVTHLAIALEVPAPLVEPDEVSGKEPTGDGAFSRGLDTPSSPRGSSRRIAVPGAPTVADGGVRVVGRRPFEGSDPTAASLSVTSGRRSRTTGRSVRTALVATLVLAASIGLGLYAKSRVRPSEATSAAADTRGTAAAEAPLPVRPALTTITDTRGGAPAPKSEPEPAASIGLPVAPLPPPAAERPRPANPRDPRLRLYKRD